MYHRIGARAGALAERIVFVGSSKTFRRLRGGARSGGSTCEVLHAGSSSREAALLLGLDLRPGDVVLVKGRDVQKLARVALRLRGIDTGCDIRTCDEKNLCSVCPARLQGPGQTVASS